MDRMSETETIGDIHVGWPAIFPDVPRVLVDTLSLLSLLGQGLAEADSGRPWPGNRDMARGQANAFTSCAEWLAEDLARAMSLGDGNALVWTER